MRPLSELVSERLVSELRDRTARGDFGGVEFETAMRFLLTDGVLPDSGLPVPAFLALEDWARDAAKVSTLRVTATELKNRTGRVIEAVLRGETVTIVRHGRPIAEVRPIRPQAAEVVGGEEPGPR